MPQSYTRIWVHAIWSTKYRQNLIHPEFEKQVYEFMNEELKTLGSPVRIINGMPDHVHCLFLLSPNKSIADTIKIVKGTSSHFINGKDFIQEKFAWQSGYAAYSVSDSILEKVYYYIKNQKQHHSKMSFQDELESYLKLLGLDPDSFHS
jgi:putative transposase